MFSVVVIGVSSGGFSALSEILPNLPPEFPLAIVIVHHLREDSDNYFAEHLNGICSIPVKESEENEVIQPGRIYVAPSNYHLLIELDGSFSFSEEPPVNYACPSIDVLFESAARAYRERLIGIILTGANSDGAKGLSIIKKLGGLAIIQNPKTAHSDFMPLAAMNECEADYIIELSETVPTLMMIAGGEFGD
ncbi:chemotaxis protein CheB [bacterium AH-315-P07]|nr:chemotaxis protein CheB [bacterium AH-315-P07]